MTAIDGTGNLVHCILAPNPTPMTLQGTNTYVVGADSGGSVVIDPGPDDIGHLEAITSVAGRVELVLFTHWHRDHTESIDRFVEMTGAPARAMRADFSRGAAPLADGEVIEAAGTALRILATPGHTSDSISVVLPEFGEHGAVITGDTILGGSTTMIDHPDGTLADFLESLDKIEALGHAQVFPAHGPSIASAADEAGRLRAHRRKRLAQIERVLAAHDAAHAADPAADHAADPARDAGIDEVLAIVYADAPDRVQQAARHSIAAQLRYLRSKR